MAVIKEGSALRVCFINETRYPASNRAFVASSRGGIQSERNPRRSDGVSLKSAAFPVKPGGNSSPPRGDALENTR